MPSDETVPMHYAVWIDRDGATTRYTFQFNDCVCVMRIADWERDEMCSTIGAVSSAARMGIEFRATVCDELMWASVELDRPVYYARARALGWHAHRPFKAT